LGGGRVTSLLLEGARMRDGKEAEARTKAEGRRSDGNETMGHL